MTCFAPVVELLADAGADLLGDLRGVDHRVHAPVDGEDQLQLPEVRLDRRLHVGILQLAGKRDLVVGASAMHLPERSGGGGMMLEACELFLPSRAELRSHAPPDEGPAHGRRLALQLHQLGGVFGREGIRDGGHQLGHLHDRSLEAAERGGELGCVPAAIEREPEQARSRDARRHAAHVGADARIAGSAGGETVGFAVGHGLVRLIMPG